MLAASTGLAHAPSIPAASHLLLCVGKAVYLATVSPHCEWGYARDTLAYAHLPTAHDEKLEQVRHGIRSGGLRCIVCVGWGGAYETAAALLPSPLVLRRR